ncbi:glutathione S-transferase domain-containing protein [Sarocladium implicatum]|nr:glutathione S-transferase domain-containing protein [Sarocladium implicatum]
MSEEYSLIYWPGIPGRGEFIRLLFEETNTPYNDIAKSSPDDAVSKILELNSAVDPDSATGGRGDFPNPPINAPPSLRHGSIFLSQTPAILLYLAPRLGLCPPASEPGYHHLNAMVLTFLDGFCAELHDTHHPIDVSKTYEEQIPEAKKRAKAFREARIPKFLGYAQRIFDSDASGKGPWLYGDSLTYADLVLFQCIDGAEFAFPKTFGEMRKSGKYNGVFQLVDAVKQRPNIKTYLASDRRAKYSMGIYRHYPELEEN